MRDLAEFLKARLDEDERVARAAASEGDAKDGRWFDDDYEDVDDDRAWRMAFAPSPGSRAHIARHDPARVLREVEAKRGIIMLYEAAGKTADDPSDPAAQRAARLVQGVYADALRLHAQTHADHPDYRAEWKP